MKPCPGEQPCGGSNQDDARFCIDCGARYVEVAEDQPVVAHMHTTVLLAAPVGEVQAPRRINWRQFNPSLAVAPALVLIVVVSMAIAAIRTPAVVKAEYSFTPQESLFLVEGDDYLSAPFQTTAFWKQRELHSLQITIPYGRIGSALGNHAYEPDYRIYVVDRTRATVNWGDQSADPIDSNFLFESQEGRTFSLNVSCAGSVRPEDAAEFLSNFAGSDIDARRDANHPQLTAAVFLAASTKAVLNHNVRQFFASHLAAAFIKMPLAEVQRNMHEVVKQVSVEADDYFGERGLQMQGCAQAGSISIR